MKLLTVVGARPQFIKASVVSKAIQKRRSIEEILVHTGQHYDANMSDVFFTQLGLRAPEIHLGIGGGSHGQNTGRMLEQLESTMVHCQPTAVMVYGDTDSTLAGALAAAKLHIPVIHVEAGLRSYNRHMPEEINRILTDQLSELLFTPSQAASETLAHEGVERTKIQCVGDVMFDCVTVFASSFAPPVSLDKASLQNEQFAVCTIHRAENTDDQTRLSAIVDALNQFPIPVILPIHPRTQQRLATFYLSLSNNVQVLPPIGYFEMQWLVQHCEVVITDSGGLQKDAFYHAKPCITVRDETEWVELVELGGNRITGASRDAIISAAEATDWCGFEQQPYGDAQASEKIADALVEF